MRAPHLSHLDQISICANDAAVMPSHALPTAPPPLPYRFASSQTCKNLYIPSNPSYSPLSTLVLHVAGAVTGDAVWKYGSSDAKSLSRRLSYPDMGEWAGRPGDLSVVSSTLRLSRNDPALYCEC